jgi:hypothetical protein
MPHQTPRPAALCSAELLAATAEAEHELRFERRFSAVVLVCTLMVPVLALLG